MSDTITRHRLAETIAQLKNGSLKKDDYLSHIAERFDTIEPQVQAFLPEDDRFGRMYDEMQAVTDIDKPLYGIPVGIKDIFHVDGLTTLAGTKLPPELFAGEQAAIVNKFRDAGAVIAGKTVTTEFAYFEPGPTRNPHNLNHTPGGSSSGSAAAIAAGLCPLAIGTQTVGSVIRPAAFCGIVGYKPSYGRIDATGVIFVSHSLDHVGLFTQDVAGMQIAASVVVENWTPPTGYPIRPVLGVPDGAYLQQASAEGLANFEEQLVRLQELGYEVRRIPVLDDIENIAEHHVDLMAYEMAQVHSEWFTEHESLYRPRTADLIRRGQGVTDERAAAARQMQADLREKFHALMGEHGINMWVSPPAPGTAPEGIGATGNPAMNLPWTNTGLPTVTVPVGKGENGLPLGLQCTSAFMTDEKLLEWADLMSIVQEI